VYSTCGCRYLREGQDGKPGTSPGQAKIGTKLREGLVRTWRDGPVPVGAHAQRHSPTFFLCS
jgi:hypothetical protein